MVSTTAEKLKYVNANDINPVEPKQLSKLLAINYKCSF